MVEVIGEEFDIPPSVDSPLALKLKGEITEAEFRVRINVKRARFGLPAIDFDESEGSVEQEVQVPDEDRLTIE